MVFSNDTGNNGNNNNDDDHPDDVGDNMTMTTTQADKFYRRNYAIIVRPLSSSN